MKKLIAAAVLGMIALTSVANSTIMYDESGNAFDVIGGKAYEVTPEESKIILASQAVPEVEEPISTNYATDRDKFKLEYVKQDGIWLKVGLKVSRSGMVVCRAIKNGKTIAITENYVDSQYHEMVIRDAGHADSASCSYK